MSKNSIIEWILREMHIFLIAVMSIGLLIYTGYRAWGLSFTIDESYTYSMFVVHSFKDIVSYANPQANNHLLNTLLMKFFSSVFPPTEFVLRLPNFLAHIFYILFTVLILKRLNNKYITLIGFVILNFNPYLLEFFSLARGYGLSTSLMLMSMYYLIVYLDKKQQKQVYTSLIFAMLALYSNLVLIPYFVSLIAVFNLIFVTDFYQKNKSWNGFRPDYFKKNIPTLIVSVIAIYICFEPVRKLLKVNGFYGRGENGFWLDTVLSFVHGSFYGQMYHGDHVRLFMVLTMLMIAVATVVFIIHYKKNGFNLSTSKGIVLLLMLVLPALVTVFQHLILGSQYLLYRTTLFFHPLLALTLIYLVYITIQESKIKFAVYALSLIITFGFMFHTVKAANLDFVFEWKFEAGTKKMINDLERAYLGDALRDRTTKPQIALGVNWLFEPTVNFYRTTRNLKWLKEANRDGVKGPYDYYYTFSEDTTGLNLNKIINTYKESNTILGK
jgi:hypothetical protein